MRCGGSVQRNSQSSAAACEQNENEMIIDFHCFCTWLSHIIVMEVETIISRGVSVCVREH